MKLSDPYFILIVNHFQNFLKSLKKDCSASNKKQNDHGTPPGSAYLKEYSNYNVKEERCEGECIGSWLLSIDSIEPVPITKDDKYKSVTVDGMYFSVGSFGFCYSSAKTIVSINYVVGQRFGAGDIYTVKHDLEGNPELLDHFYNIWIS